MKLKAGADVLGNEIKPGDYIVYGAAKGRCAGLNIGKVISNGPAGFIRAAVVQVSFGQYESPFKGIWSDDPPRKPRVSRLQFPERICVIPESSVPDKLKAWLQYT